MIFHEDFGKHLRLGNWMFKIAFSERLKDTFGLQTLYPKDYYFWKYLHKAPNFIEDYPRDNPKEVIKFPWEFSQEAFTEGTNKIIENEKKGIDTVISIDSFFQSDAWFRSLSSFFIYDDTCLADIYRKYQEKYPSLFTRRVIGISIRLGDFLGHETFAQILPHWYLYILKKYSWDNPAYFNVLVFSDDIEAAKKYFKNQPNFYYVDANNTHLHTDNFAHYHGDAGEHMLLPHFCTHMIIGNSTFSW